MQDCFLCLEIGATHVPCVEHWWVGKLCKTCYDSNEYQCTFCKDSFQSVSMPSRREESYYTQRLKYTFVFIWFVVGLNILRFCYLFIQEPMDREGTPFSLPVVPQETIV